MKKTKRFKLAISEHTKYVSTLSKGDTFTNSRLPVVFWRITSSNIYAFRASCYRISDGHYYGNSLFNVRDFYSGLPLQVYQCIVQN